MKNSFVRQLFLVVFLILPTQLWSQSEQSQDPLLPSRTIGFPIMPLIKFNQPDPVIKSSRVSKKKDSDLVQVTLIDLPIFSNRNTVDRSRIKSRNLNAGSAVGPLEENVRFDFRPLPMVEFIARDLDLVIDSSLDHYRDENIERKTKYLSLSAESNAWFISFGGEGFIFREDVSNILSIYKFKGDFYRHSYGGQGFWGLKFGNYLNNFIAIDYGVGYIFTNGKEVYHSPTLRKKEILPLYKEEFRTRGLSLAGKVKLNPVSAKLDIEKTWYNRVFASPDPLRFGFNRFNDLVTRATIEVALLPKHDQIRLVAEMTKYLGSKDRLLFRNNDPKFQLFLRIAFH